MYLSSDAYYFINQLKLVFNEIKTANLSENKI